MKDFNEKVNDLYVKGEYITRNPTIHEEDSLWKINKISPLIDKCLSEINKKEINLLDVGGGAGIILREISKRVEKNNKIKVNKFSLDLSPEILKIHKENNPDLKLSLNEDIRGTSFKNKEIDITLMVDVLEHVPDPEKCLKELQRISKYVVFKVPLEKNLILSLANVLTLGWLRKIKIKNSGHINVYSLSKLKKQLKKNNLEIIDYHYTDVFDYFRNSEHYKDKMRVRNLSINFIASWFFKLSPRLCSLLFNDFVAVLVKCH